MSTFFRPTDRSSIPPTQKEQAATEVYEQAKALEPSDPGYAAALNEIIDTVVTKHSKTLRWSNEDARILRAELSELASSKLAIYLTRQDQMKLHQSQTMLEDSKDILREEDLIFRGFSRVSKADADVKPAEMQSAIAGLGRLAATLGAPRAFDGWFAREVTETVQGDRSNNIGEYGKRARPFMMPFNEVRGLTSSDVKNKLLQKVLADNRRGVYEALGAMVASLPKGDAVATQPAFLLSSHVGGRVNLLGRELGGFREYVDRKQAPPPERFGELRQVLGHNHAAFVAANYTSVPADLRKPFDELEPVVQRRNVPNLLGALYGLTQANRLVGDVLDNGVLLAGGAPTEAGNDLQLHLVSSASHAMTQDFKGANETFGGAVADEISLLLAHHDGCPDQLPAVHAVVTKAALEAGEQFTVGGPGAKAAPAIAMKHFGDLMVALKPDSKLDAEAWRARAQDVLTRVRGEDLAQLCQETFGIGEVPTGPGLAKALEKEIDKSDYFYKRIGDIKPRLADEDALSADDRDVLRTMLYTANATWKVGQVHRAIADGDLTRVNPSERERVFNPYDMCVTAAGSDLKSFFVVAKDLLVLMGA